MPSRSAPFVLRLFSVLVALAVVVRFASQFPFVSLLVFQARDIERARSVAQGALLLWGPELTGGGTLPGGLYYWLMSLPMIFGAGWESTWLVFAVLWALAWMAAALLILRMAGWQAAWLAVAVFLSPNLYLIFLNSALSSAFFVLAEVAFLSAFSAPSREERGRSWLYGCLASGLGVQLHLSGLTILAAALGLYWLTDLLRIPGFGRRHFWKGILFFFLPLLPFGIYLVAKQFGLAIGVPAPGKSGSAAEALPSLINLAKDALDELTLSGLFDRTNTILPLALVAGGVSFFVCRPTKLDWRMIRRTRRFWVPTLAMALLSAVPAAYIFLRPIGVRYVAPFAMCMVLLIPLMLRLVLRSRRRTLVFTTVNLLFLFLFFLFWLNSATREGNLGWFREVALADFFLFLFSLVFLGVRRSPAGIFLQLGTLLAAGYCGHFQEVANTIPAFSRQAAALRVDQLRFVSEYVIRHTGWDYEEARKRLFFVNGQMHFSIQLIYDSAYAAMKAAGKVPAGKQGGDDGFFIAQGVDWFGAPSSTEFRAWLATKQIQKELRDGLTEGQIEIGEPVLRGNLVLSGYRVIGKDRLPPHFQNIGYPYELNPQHKVFPHSQNEAGVRKLGDSELLFFWRNCPERWCESGMQVKWRRQGGFLTADLKVLGAPLEQVSEWTGPGWGEMWSKPYLQVRCGEKASREVILSSIGINQDNTFKVGGMIQSYASFLAPLERSVRFHCRGPFREIIAGQEAVTLYTLNGPRVSKRRELVYFTK